jgi:hypothetical protein
MCNHSSGSRGLPLPRLVCCAAAEEDPYSALQEVVRLCADIVLLENSRNRQLTACLHADHPLNTLYPGPVWSCVLATPSGSCQWAPHQLQQQRRG